MGANPAAESDGHGMSTQDGAGWWWVPDAQPGPGMSQSTSMTTPSQTQQTHQRQYTQMQTRWQVQMQSQPRPPSQILGPDATPGRAVAGGPTWPPRWRVGSNAQLRAGRGCRCVGLRDRIRQEWWPAGVTRCLRSFHDLQGAGALRHRMSALPQQPLPSLKQRRSD